MRSVAHRLMIGAALVWACAALAAVGGVPAQDHEHHGNPTAAKIKNPVASTPASIAEGQKTYQKYCKHCHGDTGKGDGPMAPKGTMPADLTDADWDHGSTDGEIFHVIAEGAGKGSPMKGFKSKITDKETWSLVNYIRSLGPKK
jgi:mono/diheme cytochrome c family protein